MMPLSNEVTVKKRDIDADGVPNGVESATSKRAKFERSFVSSWLDKYDWLWYDVERNAMLCKVCVEQSKSNAFTDGCQNFRRDNLNKHVNTHDHKSAIDSESTSNRQQSLVSPSPRLSLPTLASKPNVTLLKTYNAHSSFSSGENSKTIKLEKDEDFTPGYLINPPFPYINHVSPKSIAASTSFLHGRDVGQLSDTPVNLSVHSSSGSGSTNQHSPFGNSTGRCSSVVSTQSTSLESVLADDEELVLKVRIANSQELDFIEIEAQRTSLSFAHLKQIMCRELLVKEGYVKKVRKLPDTIIRKDKDVRRLKDFQEIELILEEHL